MVGSRKRPISERLIREEIAKYGNSFLKRLGIENVNVRPDDIEIVRMPTDVTVYLKRGMKIVINDNVYKLTKANNLEDLLEKIKKEASIDINHLLIHFFILFTYGEKTDSIEESLGFNIKGLLSEGPASLYSFYEILKEIREKGIRNEKIYNIIKPLIFGLEHRLAAQISKVEGYSGHKVREEAKRRAIEVINNEGEHLLVNDNYRDIIIWTLTYFINSSLPTEELEMSVPYCMAKASLYVMGESYKNNKNLEKALIEVLRRYPEYREIVIREFKNGKCVAESMTPPFWYLAYIGNKIFRQYLESSYLLHLQ